MTALRIKQFQSEKYQGFELVLEAPLCELYPCITDLMKKLTKVGQAFGVREPVRPKAREEDLNHQLWPGPPV
jgi:hypothetical protein